MNGMNSKVTGLLAGLAALVVAAEAAPAKAHISIFGDVVDRGGDEKQKPCGGAKRGAKVYTFEPGATISIGVKEQIPHDGYFRISFDNDGTDDFKDPASINPVNPNRYGIGKKCQGAGDNCGKSDFCNAVSHDGKPTVLWDNIEPHLGTESASGKNWNFTVTLPNVECSNCTIQVQQVMEDPAGGFHGPFDGENDLYYRCIDIVLKRGVGKTPGTVAAPAKNKGIDCLKENPATDAGTTKADAGAAKKPDGGVYSSDDDDALASVHGDVGDVTVEPQSSEGGCSLSAGGSAQSGALLLLAFGSLVFRARRRRG